MKYCETYQRVRLMVLDAGCAMSDGHVLHLSIPDSDDLAEQFYQAEPTGYDKGPKYNNALPWVGQVSLEEFKRIVRYSEEMVYTFFGLEIQWFDVGKTTIEAKEPAEAA